MEQHKDLVQLNTFGMAVCASSYVEVHSEADVIDLIQSSIFKGRFFILGGGSNVLFTKDFEGTVVKNSIKGIDLISETDTHVNLFIGAGENWHETVLYCVSNSWGGIENLSLIPGCVGAAPIQNIGAYGVEIKDVLTTVHYIELETGDKKALRNDECQFGYRSSIFKHELKGKVLITGIELQLSKQPTLHLEYGAIKQQLADDGITHPTIKDVSNAVITIRQSKLPDPAELGNSGSFFKNPIVPKELFKTIQSSHPTVSSYPVDEQHVKLAAGWLIEQCGWKGKRVGNTGSHVKQALVLVNYGGAKGEEIVQLAQNIIQSVKDTFNVDLEPEVNII